MGELFPEETRAAIANLFYQGKLQGRGTLFIPCDYWTRFIVSPLIFCCYLLPFLVMILSIIYSIFQNPYQVMQIYQRVQRADGQTNLTGLVLVILVTALSGAMFAFGYAEIKRTMKAFHAYFQQKNNNRYHYGLLLTSNYFAIRCLAKNFDREPLILARADIVDFHLFRDANLSTKQTIYGIIVEVIDPTGITKKWTLPLIEFDYKSQILYQKLKAWLNK